MNWKKLLPFIAGIAMIGILIWWAGTEGVVRILEETNPHYLTLSLLMYFIGIITWALRWHVIIGGLEIEVRFKDTLAALFIGILFNNITPGTRGGGEAVRVYYLVKRSKATYGQLFATVTADRILDLIPVMVMLLLSAGYMYIMGFTGVFIVVLLLTIMLTGLTGIATLIITSERRMRRIVYWIFNLLLRLIPSKVKKYEEKFNKAVEINIPHFTEGLRIVVRDRKTFLLSTFYSFLTWLFVVLRNYFVFVSLGYKIGLPTVMTVQMVATAVGLISVIPGGAGIIEVTTAGVYVALGITREMAVTSSILDRIISFWMPLFLGITLTAHLGLKPKAD